MEGVAHSCDTLVLGMNLVAYLASLTQCLVCKTLELQCLSAIIHALVANLILASELLNMLKLLLALDTLCKLDDVACITLYGCKCHAVLALRHKQYYCNE